jgi:ATPase subunit of ABC transporter with duplicated ATPase domains
VAHSGGLLVISHDVGLLERCVNKVFHLDANRAELDIYAMGWKLYLQQRETDEKRRRRERLNAQRKADQLISQATRCAPRRPSRGCAQHGAAS